MGGSSTEETYEKICSNSLACASPTLTDGMTGDLGADNGDLEADFGNSEAAVPIGRARGGVDKIALCNCCFVAVDDNAYLLLGDDTAERGRDIDLTGESSVNLDEANRPSSS